MLSLVYFSTAVGPPDPAVLSEILDVSRRNNRAAGVTGLLCHLDGSYLQFLEGPDAAVQATFARIGRDPRHRDLLKVHDAAIGSRAFGDWDMGLVRADDVDAAHAALCQSLRDIRIPAAAEHRASLEGFLSAFRAWIR